MSVQETGLECQRCDRALDYDEPVVTINWHVERYGRDRGVTVVRRLDGDALPELAREDSP